MVNVRRGLGVLVAAMVVGGCASAAENLAERAIENATGSSVDIDLDTGDGSVSITDEESGLQITGGVGAELPDGFPAAIPVPEGATLISAQAIPGQGAAAMWSWPNLTREQFDAHLAEYEANGFVPDQAPRVVETGTGAAITVNYTGNGLAITLLGTIGEGETGSLTMQASTQ